MSNLVESLERWLDYLASVDRAPTLNPPATEAEIAEAEEWWGFEFVDEVRELYRYANGTDRSGYTFLLSNRHLIGLSALCSERAIRNMSYGSEGFYYGDSSGPCLPLPIVSDPGIEQFLYVVCDEVGNGAVMSRVGEPYWEARSLAEFFDYMADYGDRGLFTPNEFGVDFRRDEFEGRLWSMTEALTPDAPSHEWRWEPVEWKSEEDWLIQVRGLYKSKRSPDA